LSSSSAGVSVGIDVCGCSTSQHRGAGHSDSAGIRASPRRHHGLDRRLQGVVHAAVFAYSGVSLKVLRLFTCWHTEGVWWLAADMRLRCYDAC
jgi:hypothetical protein